MRKLVPAFAGAIMMLGMSTATYATEWMDCSDPAGEVQLGFLLGGLDFTQVSGTHLRVGEQWWTDRPEVEPGQPLALGDFFFDWKMLHASVVDENHETILAQLRVVLAESDGDDAKGGVLTLPGKGVWAVECEGP